MVTTRNRTFGEEFLQVAIPTNGPARVVVAEDELLVREGVCEILSREGFDIIVSTEDGEIAQAAIHQEAPHLAVLGIDSASFESAWNAQPVTARERTALVAIASGQELSARVGQAESAGAAALLAKPVSRAEFAPAVHIALARFLCRTSDSAPQNRRAS